VYLRIAHQRQVDEFLYRAAPDLLPYPIIFSLDLVRYRTRRPVNTAPLEVFKADLHAAVASIQGRVQRQPQARYGGDVDEVSGAMRKHDEPFFRRRQIGGQQLALSPVIFNRKN
jgi:hypothetical protein